MTRRKLRAHHYQPDPDLPAPRRGDRLCRCGLPKRHERHQVQPTDPETAAYEARRLGQREEQHQ